MSTSSWKATDQPPADASDYDENVETANQVICSVFGVPYHEAMGEWKEASKRALRYAGADPKREVLQGRMLLEHILLNPLWRDLINMAIVLVKLRVPAGMDPDEIYQVDGSWPPVQCAALHRELNPMLAFLVGVIDFILTNEADEFDLALHLVMQPAQIMRARNVLAKATGVGIIELAG